MKPSDHAIVALVFARPHFTVTRMRRSPVTTPDPKLLEGIVSPRVLEAMQRASEAMAALGVRHTVVGGLAVGANGYPRTTVDVDFLVGEEAFEHHAGGVVTLRVPVQVNGVPVDCLSIAMDEPFLTEAVGVTPGSFAPAPVVVYLKLKSPRSRDRADIVELIKAGINVDECRQYLVANAPHFVLSFDDAVRTAHAEE
jgi:hypothetical protein